ncbi:MAG: 2-phosphosulfolactate phosphatase [Candidatus Nephthysia bennettiae]|uniref:Probable 2-phosphosulfolactate phosphatase n=1 Tax=Candidatus Nephthysia bennettiae TaxID=3127016 RepID=A0A934NCD1_9BACT|nr:2-phosphosulfolactate phosphatase [Candidatus Dormibacteraeota bacterium]MBJ7613242.1 2-phosphosulfolactate phosphatase [Candidatus Dormibacteraeota bacterium]PZR96058.1 MAG: 2-phosphosulfolactate phosphatase [Candidatus Dormibacteraeota bacterium]
MRVVHAGGLEGARAARGTVVVIDVLRAFSVSAYALAGGARECRLVGEVSEAQALALRLPGAVLSAEVEGLPVPGIAISNSPTMVCEADLRGRVLVQRSSSGTQCMLAASAVADRLYAGSLVVASATARAVREADPALVTLVASGADRGHLEDRVCADYIEALLCGLPVDLPGLLEPLRRSDRFQAFLDDRWPGFPPSDLELALAADHFGFSMPVDRDELGLRLWREDL